MLKIIMTDNFKHFDAHEDRQIAPTNADEARVAIGVLAFFRSYPQIKSFCSIEV